MGPADDCAKQSRPDRWGGFLVDFLETGCAAGVLLCGFFGGGPDTQVIMPAMRLIAVQAYIRPYSADLAGADWQLQSAVELHVSDAMAQCSHLSVEQLVLSRPRIYARAHSVQRAKAAPNRNFGSQMPVQAVRTFGTRAPYRGFVSVEEHELSFPKFDGAHSKSVTRTALVSSDVAIVMP